jgi:hypothetical protein
MLFTAALVVRHHPSTQVPRPRVHGHTTCLHSTASPTETGRARLVPHQQNKAVEVRSTVPAVGHPIDRHSRMAPFDARSTGQCGFESSKGRIPGTGKYKMYSTELVPIPGLWKERHCLCLIPVKPGAYINFTERVISNPVAWHRVLSNSPFWPC